MFEAHIDNHSMKAIIDKLKAEYAEIQKKLGGATHSYHRGFQRSHSEVQWAPRVARQERANIRGQLNSDFG